jgi:hypothetical protein
MKTPLLKSRRFWTLILDTVISLVSLVVSLQFSPDVQKLVQTVIIALQPVFVALIAAFTVEDVAQARIAEALAWAKAECVEECCK